jgi:hypothetical protein
MASTKLFRKVSVITAGPALGHGMVVDADTLDQVVAAGNAAGQVKVLSDHSSSISNIIGYLEGFALDGGRVRADLVLFESHDGFSYFSEIISTLPTQIGFSISFAGIPREAKDGTVLANVSQLWSVDLVLNPAANPTGVFRAQVDSVQTLMTDTKVEQAPEIVTAPAPAALETKLAEPTITDLLAIVNQILAIVSVDASGDATEVAPAMSAKLSEPEVVAEPAPAPVAEVVVEATPELPAVAEVAVELAEDPKIVALNNELSRLKIDLEASRGTQPLEIVAPTLSRADLLKQFNDEKNPSRAAVIYQKLNQLAR